MRILLTGGTGFVGRHVLSELLAQGHEVRALIRRGGVPEGFESRNVEVVRADINGVLEQFMQGMDGVVHLVGIIKEVPDQKVTFEILHTQATQNVVKAAKAARVPRFVFVSANGVSEQDATRYQTTKWAAEEAVRKSGVEHWCILRPGLIFGDPGMEREEFCTVLASNLINPFPILPVFGDGLYQMQPIAVEEVAQSVVQALTHPDVHARTIAAVGRRRLTYIELLDVVTRALNHNPRPKIKVPVSFVRAGMRFAGGMLPITPDQLTMLLEGNVADETVFYNTFSVTERPFDEENLAYLHLRL